MPFNDPLLKEGEYIDWKPVFPSWEPPPKRIHEWDDEHGRPGKKFIRTKAVSLGKYAKRRGVGQYRGPSDTVPPPPEGGGYRPYTPGQGVGWFRPPTQ